MKFKFNFNNLILIFLIVLFTFSGCEINFSLNNITINNKITNDNKNTIPNSNIILDSMKLKKENNISNNLQIHSEVIKIKNKFKKSNYSFENIKNKTWYKPKIGDKWFWQLSNSKKVNTNLDVDIYDLDLVETPQSIIDELHRKGKKVICYFSAGSWEKYRNDAAKFDKSVLGKVLDDWEDETWLDISHFGKFSSVIEDRLNLATNKKCDGVEADNIDGYINNNGFNLTYNSQIKYNKWLAKEAHKRGLSIALKNDLNQVNDLVDYFDFEINEQCFEYDECNLLLPFIKHNKPVFGVEYKLNKNKFCDKAKKMKFDFFKANYNLDAKVEFCN